MAELRIRLLESTAFSNPSVSKKERATNIKKRAGKMSRLTKDQFGKLSNKEKESYLKHFPKSSHRKLMGREAKQAEPKKGKGRVSEPKDEKLGKTEKAGKSKKDKSKKKEKPKKLTRQEFDSLPPKEQKAYKKAWPKDSFKGKKHHVAKKKNVVQKNKTGEDGETVLDGYMSNKEREKAEKKALKASRDEAKRDLRHGVTKEAVDALRHSAPEDLKQAGESLKADRTENIQSIKDTLNKKSEFVSFTDKDIKQADRALKRETERDESTWKENDLKQAKKLLESLNGGDTQKLSHEDRELLGRVSESKSLKKEPFWKRDLKTLKSFVTGEKIEPEGRSNGLLALGVVARYALIAGGVAALAMGAAPAALHISQTLFSQWDAFNSLSSTDGEDGDENEDLIGVAYDAVADYLQNADHEEFIESIDSTFLEFRAKASANGPLLFNAVMNDMALASRVSKITPLSMTLAGSVEQVLERLSPLLMELGFEQDDTVFTDDNGDVEAYALRDNRVVLALPSPSLVDNVMECD